MTSTRAFAISLALALTLCSWSARAEPSGPILDGVPEIPADLVERLTQYESTRWASMRSVADDGSSILITTRLGETGQVHRVQQAGGARTQATAAEKAKAALAPLPDHELKDMLIDLADYVVARIS